MNKKIIVIVLLSGLVIISGCTYAPEPEIAGNTLPTSIQTSYSTDVDCIACSDRCLLTSQVRLIRCAQPTVTCQCAGGGCLSKPITPITITRGNCGDGICQPLERQSTISGISSSQARITKAVPE